MDEQQQQLELAYLAGFVDGEGSIAVGVNRSQNGNRRWYLRFSVHQVNPEPLQMLSSRFSGSVRKTERKGNQRAIFEWVASSSMAARALTVLRPYLRVKALEADLALQFQSLIIPVSERRSGLTLEQEEQRESLYRRLQEAKRLEYNEYEGTERRPDPKPKPPKKVRVKTSVPVKSTGYKRRVFDDADIGILRGIYTDHGLAATAIEYGVSRQTVVNWLDRYGIPKTGRTPASEARRAAAVSRSWTE